LLVSRPDGGGGIERPLGDKASEEWAATGFGSDERDEGVSDSAQAGELRVVLPVAGFTESLGEGVGNGFRPADGGFEPSGNGFEPVGDGFEPVGDEARTVGDGLELVSDGLGDGLKVPGDGLDVLGDGFEAVGEIPPVPAVDDGVTGGLCDEVMAVDSVFVERGSPVLVSDSGRGNVAEGQLNWL
jgi:hypothetical protein